MRILLQLGYRRLLFSFAFILCCASSSAQIDTSLLSAIRGCNLPLVQVKLTTVNDLNKKDANGADALMWAAYYCDLPMVSYLIKKGAKVPHSAVIFTNDEGAYYSSLQSIAARQGKLQLLKYLTDSLKLPLNEKEKQYSSSTWKKEGRTPLSCAAEYGHLDVVKYLLQKAVDVDDVDIDSTSTPLIKAAEGEHWDIFQLLMQTNPIKERFGAKASGLLATAVKLQQPFPTKAAREVAIKEFTLKLRKIRFGEASVGYAAGLNRLAVAVENTGEYWKAEQLYQQATDLLKRISADNHGQYIISLQGLAFNYYNTARYPEAISLLKQAQATIKRTYKLEQRTADFLKVANDDPDLSGLPHIWPVGYNLTLQALMYGRMGDYQKAARLYEKASVIVTEAMGEEHETAAFVHSNAAFLYTQMGLYEEAIDSYQKASDILKDFPGKANKEQYAAMLFDLAHTYCQLGQLKEALPLFEKASPVIKQSFGEKHPYYARVLGGMGFIYEQIGEYEKARSYYSQELRIYQRSFNNDHPYCAGALNNLASVYTSSGEYEKALSSYHKALAIRKRAVNHEHPAFAQSLTDLASLYDRLGNYDSALYLYEQALSFTKNSVGEEHYQYANCLVNLASLFARVEKTDTAIHLYKQVLRIREKVFGREYPDNVKVLNNLGWLHQISKDSVNGHKALLAASNLQLNHLKRGYSILSEQEKMVFQNKAAYEFSYIPSMLYLEPSQPSLVKQAYQNELALKGMILEDQKQILNDFRRSNDSTMLTLYERWRLNKSFLGTQLLLPAKQRVPYFDSLENTANQLEQELSRRGAAPGLHMSQRISGKDIAEKLGKEEAAVEFLRFHVYTGRWTDRIMYAAIVLLPGDTVGNFISLFEEKQLLCLLGSSSNGKSSDFTIEQLYGNERGTGTLSDSLYALIWKPLEKHLSGIHTIYYAPTGLLHRIAFNALRNDSTDFLIDQYDLRRVLSTRSLMHRVPAQPGFISASIWGNINYSVAYPKATSASKTSKQITRGQNNITVSDSSFLFYNSDTRGIRNKEWPHLKAAEAEVDTLNRVLGSAGIQISSFSGSTASEEAFKTLDGKSPQLLHLATHGFFLPIIKKGNQFPNDVNAGNAFRVQRNPLFRSGLVLAGGNHTWLGRSHLSGQEDGILTAYEIAQLDLTNTRLLVLTACETALGDLQGNEGVIGLQRAFKLAGVPQMVLTLWSVYDDPTRELITMFYRNLLVGQSTSTALRNAQLKMKEEYPEPYYWGGFILVE